MARYVDPARSGAVLIGVGSYIDPGLTDIAAVDANLTDLHRLVSDPSTGSFAGDKCVLVTAPERSRQVGDVVRRVARSTTDVLLVYYTGHGLIDRRGRLHLALAGSDPDRIGWTTLPLEALCEELLDSPAAIRILILDCCFTCPAAESMITVSAMVAEQVEVEGIYTVVSCVTDHSSFAPAGCRNTVMTAALLATLATTPELSLDELFAGLDGSLTRRAHPHPRRRGVDAVGELVLFSKPGPRYRDAATSDDIEATIELAGTHFDRGEYDQAEPWYRKAAEHGHPEAMKILGGLLEQRGEFTEAETWYRKAADAGDTEAITNLGWLLERRGELTEAEAWYRKAADAEYAAGMASLGWLLDQRGELTEAETWHRKAADAGDTEAITNLGWLLERRGELTEAEAWYRKAADAEYAAGMASLGWLLDQRGELTEAETWHRKAADAGVTPAITNLGWLLERRGELTEAETWHRKAADAGDTQAMINLGNVLVERGEMAEAEMWYRKAADTGHASGMYCLGWLLEQRGEFTEAETWYRKAADTGHLKAKDSLKWLIKYRGDRAKAQNNATSDVLVGAVLHSTVQAALRSTAERQKPRPVDTHALLVELIRIDFSGDWTRIVLHAPALGAFSVPSDPGGGRVRWWEDVALTPTCAIALDAAGHLAHRYNLWPIPVGLVALALIADPTTAAAKASRGESSRGELLMMIQAEVLGMTLTGFDSAAAAALTAARNPTRTRYSRHLHSGRATSSGTGSTQPSQPFYANPVWIGALIAAVLFVVLHFIGLFP